MANTPRKVPTTTAKTKSTTKRKKPKPLALCLKEVCNQIYKKDSIVISGTNEYLTTVMKWGKFTKEQACLFAFFAAYCMDEDDWSQFNAIQQEITVDYTGIAYLLPDLEDLIIRGFFNLRFDFKPVKGIVDRYTQFYLPEEIHNQIVRGEKFKPVERNDKNNQTDTLSFLYRYRTGGLESNRSFYEMIVKTLYKDNEFLSKFLDDRNDFGIFSAGEALIFFVLAGVELLDQPKASVKAVANKLYGAAMTVAKVLAAFKQKTTWFQKNGVFEIDPTNLGDDICIRFTKSFKDNLFTGDYELLVTAPLETTTLGRFEVDKIQEKELFYNESNEKDVRKLESIFEEDRYNSIRSRLKSEGMPLGVVTLLYGGPGTGKTETVMQLAKRTGRDILHVNIQEIRSCWVGESEKNVKAIFENYKNYKSEKKPILLFNEADAIVSTRTSDVSGSNSAVNKMENAMQNIILEELENFDGLLAMTTNLQSTLDPAFERRILFKLKFDNPTKDVKKKIWKSKLKDLTDSDLDRVACFDFSGGQIENVRRKIVIDEVVDGKKPSIEEIVDYCKKETLQKEEFRSIGFCTD